MTLTHWRLELPVGHRLKALRKNRKLTVRDVEQATHRIAAVMNDNQYLVSDSSLTRLEKGRSGPTIYKLFTLSAVYNVNLLELYGIDLADIKKLHSIAFPDKTQLLPNEMVQERSTASLQELETELLAAPAGIELEHALSGRTDLSKLPLAYGYIGFKDFTMFPLVRPGAIVRIDTRQDKLSSQKWRTEYERPIYFIELRGGYACGWCELQNNQLTIVPHHSGPGRVRHYNYPHDAELVGRVISFDTPWVDDSVE
ncbi:MAG: helix-turn-helix domain-containing protein [Pyrinomonadaceae bacterium]